MSDWSIKLAQRLAAWRAAGLARRLRVAEGTGTRLLLDGRAVLNFASNDYLGLSAEPRVVAAAKAALERHGAGATSSRLLSGTRTEHAALEAELARFKRTEAALVCASGYQAALAALGALADSSCAIVLDRLCHACLLDGARLSGARVRTFKHNDAEDLRRILRAENAKPSTQHPGLSNTSFAPTQPHPRPLPAGGEGRRALDSAENPPAASRQPQLLLVVVESLYSMDGDVAPLREIHQAARESGALLLVDEAHATGVLGEGGRGALAGLFPGNPLPPEIVSLGTLSKALGSQGGFVCASRAVVDTLVHAGRAFLFSTGLAPASAAAAREALRIAAQEPARRAGLLERAAGLRRRLSEQGWEVLGGPGPILPILAGGEKEAARLADRLLERGVWVPAVRYPTVKRGQARLRISLSAAHTQEDLERLAEVLCGTGVPPV